MSPQLNPYQVSTPREQARSGFSLVEVILALGIFLVAILALVGLLGPSLSQVEDIVQTDEIASVVSTVNAFVQGSPFIAEVPAAGSKGRFQVLYEGVKDNDAITLYVFNYYVNDDDTEVSTAVGFAPQSGIGQLSTPTIERATVLESDLRNAVGAVFRVVLSASSVNPPGELVGGSGAQRDPIRGVFTLQNDFANFGEGVLALEARLFVEPPPGPTANLEQFFNVSLQELADREPAFRYSLGIVR